MPRSSRSLAAGCVPTVSASCGSRGGCALPTRLPLMGFVSASPLRRHAAYASTPCSSPTPLDGVPGGPGIRDLGIAPADTSRLRDAHSAPDCPANGHSSACSAPAVSHDFDGLLRIRGAGLLHPAADHGVRLVARTLGGRVEASRRVGPRSNRRSPPIAALRGPSIAGGTGGEPRRRSTGGEAFSRTVRPEPCCRQATAWCPSSGAGCPVLTSERRQPVRRPAADHLADTAGRSRRAAPTDLRGSRRQGVASRSRCGVPLPSFSRALLTGAVTLRSLPLVHSRTASPRPLPSRRCVPPPVSSPSRPKSSRRVPRPLPAVLKVLLRVRVRCPTPV